MTQKILFIISGILILGALITIIITNKPKVSNKILTVDTEYNYVYTDTKLITVKLYSNTKKHKIHFKENINYSFLVNSDETNRFELDLVSIEYSHEEMYVGDLYYCYNYNFKMPRLETNLLIEDALLEIELVNGITYNLKIGKFKFLYYPNIGLEKGINILGLYGYKLQGSEFPRLNKIIIESNNLGDVLIESISINGENKLIFQKHENEIHVTIPFEKVLLFQAPLIMTITKNGQTFIQVIDNFLYFTDYETLSSAKDISNLYEAN